MNFSIYASPVISDVLRNRFINYSSSIPENKKAGKEPLSPAIIN